MFPQGLAFVTLLALAHGGLISGGLELGGLGYGGLGGISTIGGSGITLAGKQTVVDLVAPPKYEYKYAVQDPHTGDQKEQQEYRSGDLTKSEYELAEKDRKIQVSRIIAGNIPIVNKGYSIGGYGKL
ncbi:uncharacterized protein [Leptinotarsa decemlineata]|uniref:uncharacterized protein n=1 Tax=Leptinotarsa decemlineata TaxID=7539 RepID=UPI003D308880